MSFHPLRLPVDPHCPHCESRDVYFDKVPKRRHVSLNCRACGYTSDHTVRRLREVLGRDPDTGEKV